jgi:hypothetical protein
MTNPSAPRLVEPAGLSVAEWAYRLGHYTWLEERTFAVLGGWVRTEADHEVKLHLAEHCHHHAWHAQVWRDHLPALGDATPESFVRPRSDATAAALEALAASATTLERLVAVARVLLPRKVAAYEWHLARASAVSEGPTRRWLSHVLLDERDQWAAAEALLQTRLRSADDVRTAAGHQAQLEALLVEAGGLA